MPSETQLREIFAALGDGVFIADAQGAYLDVNPAACRMLGYSKDQILKLSLADLLDPSEWLRLPETIASFQDGAVRRSEWLFRRGDGSTFPGELVGGRLPDGRFQSVVRDISERRERERHEQLLVREASHRTKNILALVKAIARQTAASPSENFVEAFDKRVASLAASHNLFIARAWQPVSVEDLVRAQLAAFDARDARILVSGPPTMITPAAAQSFGMVLHELATNAAKYGALSSDGGRVEIKWSADPSKTPPAFTLSWTERGGPPVEAPQRQGFGTRMMAQLVERALRATTALDFNRDGLTWRLECPLQSIAQDTEEGADATVAALTGDTGQRRVFFLAKEAPASLMEALENAGMTVAGWSASAQDLLARLDENAFDAVVIDDEALGEASDAVLSALGASAKAALLVVDAGQHPTRPVYGADVAYRPLRAASLVSRLAIMLQARS